MDRREALKTAGGLAIMVGCPTASVSMAMAEPPPYDPVAVLEAMRAAGFQFGIFSNPNTSWSTTWCGKLLGPDVIEWVDEDFLFESFVDAVKSLHQRAAAVDAEFAAMWPVPAEVKQDG